MTRSPQEEEVDLLIDAYRKAAIGQARAMEALNPREGNRHAKEMIRIDEELNARGARGELAQLLGDPEPWVRCCAASAVLDVLPALAVRTLEALEREAPGFSRTTAVLVLKRWRQPDGKQ